MSVICRHYLISGRVQGVWYRATAQKLARHFGITGWAKNLPDGRVEILASGTASALDEFKQLLWKKPRLARVTDITCKTLDNTTNFTHFDDFSIVF